MFGATATGDPNIWGSKHLGLEGPLPRGMVNQLGGDNWKARFGRDYGQSISPGLLSMVASGKQDFLQVGSEFR